MEAFVRGSDVRSTMELGVLRGAGRFLAKVGKRQKKLGLGSLRWKMGLLKQLCSSKEVVFVCAPFSSVIHFCSVTLGVFFIFFQYHGKEKRSWRLIVK